MCTQNVSGMTFILCNLQATKICKQVNLKLFGSMNSNGLNNTEKIGYGHLCGEL
jgi:hypothetical protein